MTATNDIRLDYGDYQDFYDAARDFCTEMAGSIQRKGGIVWDVTRYNRLLGEPLRYNGGDGFESLIENRLNECPPWVNKSLWRQGLLNNMHGLYHVQGGVYQIRGYDLANITIVETISGIVVIDCVTACETAKAALELYWEYKKVTAPGSRFPVKAVILTHTHVDHYGGILGVREANRKRFPNMNMDVYAPEHFLEEAALENAIVGDAMARRSTYQYGTFLDASDDGTGKVDAGLGKDIQRGGTISFAAPSHIVVPNYTGDREQRKEGLYRYEGLPVNIDGVNFEFLLCPGTEAPAEMTVWCERDKVLVAAEVATHTLHNLLTPRGAEVRDARLWWKALEKLRTRYGKWIKCLCATHHWPIWDEYRNGKTGRCDTFLGEQRDTYKFLHDQTVRLINRGYTMLEIAAWFDEPHNLPDFMRNRWHNRGYYGTISHDVRAIYQKYIGWYDMNPANLNPLPPEETAKRYINAIGYEKAYKEINKILDAMIGRQLPFSEEEIKDLRWAAELGKHLVYCSPNYQPYADINFPTTPVARQLVAKVHEYLGQASEAGTWRNMYLVAAGELKKGGPLEELAGSAVNTSILEAMDDELLFDYWASRFLPKTVGSCGNDIFVQQCGVRQSTYRLDANADVLGFWKAETTWDRYKRDAVYLVLERTALVQLLLKHATLQELVDRKEANIYYKGAIQNSEEFFVSMLQSVLFNKIDAASPNFNIVLPKKEAQIG